MSRVSKNKKIRTKKLSRFKLIFMLIMVIVTISAIFLADYSMNKVLDRKNLIQMIEQNITSL